MLEVELKLACMGCGDACAVCGREVVRAKNSPPAACDHVVHDECIRSWAGGFEGGLVPCCMLCRPVRFRGPHTVALVLLEGCVHCDSLRAAIGRVDDPMSLPFKIVDAGANPKAGAYPHFSPVAEDGTVLSGSVQETNVTRMAEVFTRRAEAAADPIRRAEPG